MPSKMFNIPVFEPIMLEELDQFVEVPNSKINVKEMFKQYENDFIKQGSLIKIHHNPMVFDFNNSYQMLNNKIYERTHQVKGIIKNIIKRAKEDEDTTMMKD